MSPRLKAAEREVLVERPGWYVVCRYFVKGPSRTEEEAKRVMDGITRMGNCPETHEVVECR